MSAALGSAARKAARIAGNALVRPLSSRWPRRKDLWLFGHQGDRFEGNAKFLYLWLVANRPDLKPLWITGREEVAAQLMSQGLPFCRRGTVGAAKAMLNAGVHLFCHGPEDVGVALGGGALLVNLWHGVGLKAIQFGDPGSIASYYARPEIGWLRRMNGLAATLHPDLLIATSPFTANHFAGQFRLPLHRCPPLGYSRLDVGLDQPLTQLVERVDAKAREQLGRAQYREIYVYAPTFRDTARDFLAEALPDPARLDAVLRQRQAVLYLKLHPHTRPPRTPFGDRIRFWPASADLYSCLPQIDSLITDYSSIHYDWIFHSDRGAVIYAFDAAEYVSQDRKLLYPFEDNVAGWWARGFRDLVEMIASGTALRSHPSGKHVRDKFWGSSRKPSSPRIVAAIEDALG